MVRILSRLFLHHRHVLKERRVPEGLRFRRRHHFRAGRYGCECERKQHRERQRSCPQPRKRFHRDHHGLGQSSGKTILWTFSTTHAVSGAKQVSAEWITEADYGCRTSNKICFLSDFGTASYGQDYAPTPEMTGYATVGGVTGPLGSFTSGLQQIIMVDANGTVMAEPSPSCPSYPTVPTKPFCSSSSDASDLQDSGSSFQVNWYNAGP